MCVKGASGGETLGSNDKLRAWHVDGRGVCPRWRSFSFRLGSSAMMHTTHMPTRGLLSRLLASMMASVLRISLLDVTIAWPPQPLSLGRRRWYNKECSYSFDPNSLHHYVATGRLFSFLFLVGTTPPPTLGGAIRCTR